MKYTLIDMVQEILSDMDSDEVDSIEDTVEAEQVATIVKSTYLAMMSNRDWPHLRKGITITSFSDVARPTHMKLPPATKEVCFVNYNTISFGETKHNYQEMVWLEPDDFIRRANTEDDTKSYVQTVVDPSGIEIFIRNDKAPKYYTSFNDEDLVFDAFDNTAGTTLKESNVQAQAYVMPSWTMTDLFIPDLPDVSFISLIEEAKAKASFKLRQVVDQKAEQEAGRQRRWLARKSRRLAGGIRYPNYGRRSRKTPVDSTFSRS